MKRLFELTSSEIEEWRQARQAYGSTIYGDRDLQRYNLVDVIEELLDCLNILDRFNNRAIHQDFVEVIPEKYRLVEIISEAVGLCKIIDQRLPDNLCTDENGGKRIWWNQ